MSFRPDGLRTAECSFREQPVRDSAIRNPQFAMPTVLRPRLELGSRTNLVLARYKLAALPIELPEQFKQLVRPYGLEPSSHA